jgi:transcriptional regulator with XRE-family HTH domain
MNIRRIRKRHGWSRDTLAHMLNLGPVSPSDPPYGEGVKPWTGQRVVALEHGHKDRTPNLSIDDAFAVCRALRVPIYELILPESSDENYTEISGALFGFELTDSMIDYLRKRSELHNLFRNHPEVTEASLADYLAWQSLFVQSAKASDPEERRRLSDEAFEARARSRDIARLKVESLQARLGRGEIEMPTEEDARDWSEESYRMRTDKIGRTGGERD